MNHQSPLIIEIANLRLRIQTDLVDNLKRNHSRSSLERDCSPSVRSGSADKLRKNINAADVISPVEALRKVAAIAPSTTSF